MDRHGLVCCCMGGTKTSWIEMGMGGTKTSWMEMGMGGTKTSRTELGMPGLRGVKHQKTIEGIARHTWIEVVARKLDARRWAFMYLSFIQKSCLYQCFNMGLLVYLPTTMSPRIRRHMSSALAI